MIHFLEQHFVELVTITSIIYLTLATILLLYQTPDTAVYDAHQPEYMDLDSFIYRKLDGI